MKHRQVWLGVLLAGLCGPAAQARDGDASQLRFAPAAGVQVRAQALDDGRIAVQLQPSGVRQQLPGVDGGEDNTRLSAEDIDFDGYPELVARASVGMVNEAVSVYRYDHASGRLQPLDPPANPQASCGSLMGLNVDAATRTLASSCRSGPMWFLDFYRYHGAQLYLYRSERVIHGPEALDDVLAVDAADTDTDAPLAVWRTFDASGKVVEQAVNGGLDAPDNTRSLQALGARVRPARLPLYAAPGDTATPRYLVQGDRVELLDERDGWLQVRYHNARRGAVLGWVNAGD